MLTVNAAGIQDEAGNSVPARCQPHGSWTPRRPPARSSALPSQTTSTSFVVSATGTDPSGSNGSTPSGIASYAIYVSTDGGPFSLFATVTPTDPSAIFTGQAGNTYGFYSIATDNAGNVQATPAKRSRLSRSLRP